MYIPLSVLRGLYNTIGVVCYYVLITTATLSIFFILLGSVYFLSVILMIDLDSFIFFIILGFLFLVGIIVKFLV